MMTETSKNSETSKRTRSWWSKNWFYITLVLVAVIGGGCAFTLPYHFQREGDNIWSLRQAILAATGGVLAILTLWENRRKNIQEKEKNDQDHTRQVHAERRARYAKAIEQLADDKSAIRLGGVYTLAKLVDDWLDDEKTLPSEKERRQEGQIIIDSLCAYIRSSFPLAERHDELTLSYEKYQQKYHVNKQSHEEFVRDKSLFREEKEVRQTILSEIKKRLNSGEIKRENGKNEIKPGTWSYFEYDFLNTVFFYRVSFRNSYFGASLNFSGAEFAEFVDFSGAEFAEFVDFTGATITWNADFSGAKFTEFVDFSRATITWNADFSGAKFTKASFSKAKFTQAGFFEAAIAWKANFFKAEFTEADFSGAEFAEFVGFTEAEFTEFVDFTEAEFTQAGFIGATIIWSADFSGAKFTKASFSKAKFTEVSFSGATITKDADFSGATITWNADFSGAKFTKFVDFTGATITWNADFSGAEFTKASFSKAKFTEVSFSGAEFTKADFSGAEFTKADFSGAEFTEASFSEAIFEYIPIFRGPDGFNLSIPAKFSCKAEPKDYNFEVSYDSPYKIETEEQEHNGVNFTIPKGATLFDPDEPSEQEDNGDS